VSKCVVGRAYPEPCEELPSATEIAGIYRGLRKGLEDSSNGPGAADFYYGEMEMRRLSGREKGPKSSAAARSERCLLTAYWAVSGYGLRAWRAFTAFASLILIHVLGFSTASADKRESGIRRSANRGDHVPTRGSIGGRVRKGARVGGTQQRGVAEEPGDRGDDRGRYRGGHNPEITGPSPDRPCIACVTWSHETLRGSLQERNSTSPTADSS